ncbi:lipid-A-disaccharide synthase [Mangrovicoccus algicola]|uniref:Lipid-A-disaccharide synthase n=1 Tax=Mangrovicoccus algicola TaxID=2771008 RepID=A0A8J6YTA4_9RHOB|nr:lipid-A-disaccharide synthase [Mangrovicoccus algicola]MBE3637072.1 lipid-A-disaccharide synthase [Mangrovicoccus algicola]
MGDLTAAPRLFLLAGEPSGDALGGALAAGLRDLAPGVSFDGVAGPLMRAAGVPSLFPMEELSVMGLAEIVPRYLDLRRRLHQTAAHVVATRPDALVTIDAPDFSLRLAALVRAQAPEIRTIHYVAPSVWAWRPGRAKKMARMIDQVLALLPFEPPYMEAEGMRCDFVGHPVAAEQQPGPEAARRFRDSHGIAPDAPLVLVLPGSRKGEVSRLAPVFGPAIAQVAAARPGARFVLPAAAPVAGLVRELAAGWPVTPIILDPGRPGALAEKAAAFAAADVALAASGTVSLELAASATPMVIAYRFSGLTNAIMKRMALTDTVTLVNLVSESRVVPEFLMENCRPEPIAAALLQVLAEPEAQKAAAALTMDRLGRGGPPPGLRAAEAVLSGLRDSRRA